MNHLRSALLMAVVLLGASMCFADFEDIGGGISGGNVEEGRFLGLLKKKEKTHVETYTNYVPYPYPVPVAVPVYGYQSYGHYGKPGFGKGFGHGFDKGFGHGFGGSFDQGYYQGYPNQYSNIGPAAGGYSGFGSGFAPGYGYFK